MMKRGSLRSYVDSSKIRNDTRKDFQESKNRGRPFSKLEERIRLRRSQRVKSPFCEILASSPKNISKNSTCSRSSSGSTSTSTSDSSGECLLPRGRGSKQRVELLELVVNRPKHFVPGKKINRGRHRRRTKSAPCSFPIFRVKYTKDCSGCGNFVDRKIVEKDCIAMEPKSQLPSIGNPALVSLMIESLDKLQLHQVEPPPVEGEINEDDSTQLVIGNSESSDQEFREHDLPEDPVSEVEDLRWEIANREELPSANRKSVCGRNCCRCCIESDEKTEENDSEVIFGTCEIVKGIRSRSSPRRVTFKLPALIPEEEEVRKCRCENCCSGQSTEESMTRAGEKTETKRCRDCGLKKRSRNPGVQVQSFGGRGSINSGHRDETTVVVRQENTETPRESGSETSVTSVKDWAVETDENLDSFWDISFPKETRLAMNVLMHSRVEGGTITRCGSRTLGTTGKQHQLLREARVLKKPDLEIFNGTGQHCQAMHVATYAQALAVFQRKRDPLAGGSCKKKRHVVWKGSDGEIHSEYTSASEFTLPKDVKRAQRSRNVVIRKPQDPESYNRTFNGPGRNSGEFTMQTNGSDNGSSENGVDRTGWTVGLINGRFKYLTAETFGFKINANGASLKKKQLWTLEGSEHQVYLRSHLDRYLAVDQFGNVTCEAEDNADPGCAFQIQVASDGSGRWALKNIQRGYFLGSSQDELKCTAKVPGDAEYWLVHLAARPQVNLRSAGRKRFAHLSAAQDEIHVDAPVPWGEDTLFTLEFRPAAMPDAVDGNSDVRRDVRSEAGIGGHYALHTCNNKYLARDGKLLDSCTRDCLYAAEFHAGMLALRDVSGAYLAPIGSKAVLKSRSNTVTRDELFSLEDSLPQASFVAALNQRYVSVKQGVDVTANQDEISGHETFQLEFDRATKRWYLRTMQDRYWTLEAGGGIQASDHKRSSNALFDLVWQPADGTVALRANNGKFLATKRSGHLYANAEAPGDTEASKFYFYLMNRPVLVLRCEQGFVGLKSNASPKLECNKASYETIRVERCDRGIVRFKGQNGKYWHADSEGVTSDADVPSDGFYLELREPSRICIKSTDGRYLSAGKNGVFRLGDTDYESATKWEF